MEAGGTTLAHDTCNHAPHGTLRAGAFFLLHSLPRLYGANEVKEVATQNQQDRVHQEGDCTN